MIGSLTARIFAIFWLTLALVLMLVLMLPKLDSRQMTELLDSEQRQGYDSVANADHRYGRHFPDNEFGEHRLNAPDDASADQKCRGGKLVRLHGSADRPFDDDL